MKMSLTWRVDRQAGHTRAVQPAPVEMSELAAHSSLCALTGIVLMEGRRTQKATYCVIPFT